MDASQIGKTIASLRRKNSMTQAVLAEKLGVSNKAVSKWENGQGYPDISVFPALASLFDVSVDYLMLGEKKGIAVAGNIIIDNVKNIDCFPKPGMLAYVSEITPAVGGCVPNTAIDLARIDGRLDVSAIGCVGNDENGRFAINELKKNGVNVERVCFKDKIHTSFCDVMSLPDGERTFFHCKGANAYFSPEQVDASTLNADILHIGYILLMDEFDREDEEYGTVLARFLDSVCQCGIKTSVDVVSDSNADYSAKIVPVQKYVSYFIVNELECCRTWGLEAVNPDGSLNEANVRLAMEKCVGAGVREKVIVHSKEKAFILDAATGSFVSMGSLMIPHEAIKGSVGAGDAFCAGCLYGLHNSYSDEQILEFATAAAACSLFAANSTDGMVSRNEIFKIAKKYSRRK